MSEIVKQRVTAEIDGEFCVFLIGMRINRPWKVHQWWFVSRAMGRMLEELQSDPHSDLLHVESWLGRTSILVQYWRSFEALEAYAKDRQREHRPAWARFNKQIGSNGDVGIWHETYRVPAGHYECVYNNMPPFGLAAAAKLVPATGARESAAGRMSAGLT